MPKRINQVDLAMDWLREQLKGGRTVPRLTLINEGKNLGFSRHVVGNAARRLGVMSVHLEDSFRAWRMPRENEVDK